MRGGRLWFWLLLWWRGAQRVMAGTSGRFSLGGSQGSRARATPLAQILTEVRSLQVGLGGGEPFFDAPMIAFAAVDVVAPHHSLCPCMQLLMK